MITNETNGDQATDKMNIFTVCNETYTTDTYLVPTPSSSHQSGDSDHFLPLLETRVSGFSDSEQAKIEKCCEDIITNMQNTEHEICKSEESENVRLEDINELAIKDENVQMVESKLCGGNTEHNGKLTNNNRVITNRRGQEPMFRKKTENSLPTIRYTKNNKNKHVIYPSENVALLTESGSARCIKDSDTIEQETSQC